MVYSVRYRKWPCLIVERWGQMSPNSTRQDSENIVRQQVSNISPKATIRGSTSMANRFRRNPGRHSTSAQKIGIMNYYFFSTRTFFYFFHLEWVQQHSNDEDDTVGEHEGEEGFAKWLAGTPLWLWIRAAEYRVNDGQVPTPPRKRYGNLLGTKS